MSTKVEFKFDVDNMVKTILGDKGLVTMCAINEGPEHQYFVVRSNGSNWHKESELTIFID